MRPTTSRTSLQCVRNISKRIQISNSKAMGFLQPFFGREHLATGPEMARTLSKSEAQQDPEGWKSLH